MRIVGRLVFLTAVVAAGFLAQATQARPAREEPPFEFRLVVAGTPHDVVLDQPLEVTIDGKVVRMMLSARPDRLFDNEAGVTFRYPRAMAWAYEAGEGTQTWTLDGNDCVLLVNRFTLPGMTPAVARTAMVEGMIEEFGEKNVRSEGIEVDLGGTQVEATRLHCRLVGTSFVHDIVAVPVARSVLVLTLQVTLGDDGRMPAEAAHIRRLLAKTWQVAK